MADHELKTWPQFFAALSTGHKTFEVRRNDRGFAPGDRLILREWDPETRDYTGPAEHRTISYVLTAEDHEGVAIGFAVLGFEGSDRRDREAYEAGYRQGWRNGFHDGVVGEHEIGDDPGDSYQLWVNGDDSGAPFGGEGDEAGADWCERCGGVAVAVVPPRALCDACHDALDAGAEVVRAGPDMDGVGGLDEDDWTADGPDTDERTEYEDERRAKRGTSECDGICDPTCAWCLAGHDCPDQCGGGDDCPYVALAREEARPKTLPAVEE